MKTQITPHGHKRECRFLKTYGLKKCNCMTAPERRRYLAWLEAACKPNT